MPRRRDDKCSTGPLALASAACPALRELEVASWYLDQPPAPLEHLKCLSVSDIKLPPEGAAPLRRLAAAAPRLQVLEHYDVDDTSVIAAAEGHPCLHKLRVLYRDQEAWLLAIPQLPALLTLELSVHSGVFMHEEVEGQDGTAAHVACVFDWLARCKRLLHLKLDISPEAHMSAHGLLAAVGTVVGGRLRSLTINHAKLPLTADAAARAMHTLVACA